MKALLTFIITIFLLNSYVSGQTARSNEAGLLNDPKLTEEERAAINKAGKENPSVKDREMFIDPKLNADEIPDEKWYGEQNNGKKKAEEREEIFPETPRTTSEAQNGNSVQKEGEKPGSKIHNFKQNGPNSQPEAERPGNLKGYQKGTGAEQVNPDSPDPE